MQLEAMRQFSVLLGLIVPSFCLRARGSGSEQRGMDAARLSRRPNAVSRAGFSPSMCAGSLGTLLFLGDALPDDYRICRPRGAVLHDAVRIVVSHVEAQPERGHENFNGLSNSTCLPCSARCG